MKVRFCGFTWDREAGRLSGAEGEVRLRPQAYRMFEVLAGSAPKILSQEDLLDRVWGVEHLSPASVKQAISEVRQALGDDPGRPRIIETVHRRGYRFIAPLERVEDPVTDPPAVPLAAPPSNAAAPSAAVGLDEPAPVSYRRPVAESPLRRPVRRHGAFALRAFLLAGFAAASLLEGSLPASPSHSARPSAEPRTAAVAAARPSLAILGFRNLSERSEDGWISAALTEILRFELIAPGTLRLIPADNVLRMQRELKAAEGTVGDAGLGRVGENLGTRLVMAGSYLVSPTEAGTEVRVQVTVQDVASGETIAWARQTGSVARLLDLARAASKGILSSLGHDPRGPSGEAASVAANGESLRLWSEAMGRLAVRDAVGAIARLDQARRTDPDNPFLDDALAVAWSRLGFDSRAAEAAGRALARAGGLPEEIRWVLSARAHEMRFEMAQARKVYEKLWSRFPDNLDYGLSLAAAQRQSGSPEISFATAAALRKLAPPDGEDPRIDLAESDAAWGVGDFPRCRDAAERAVEKAEGRKAILLTAAGRVARGWAYIRLGQLDAARADLRAAGAIYRRSGDRGAAASARAAEAHIDQSEGRVAQARRIYEESVRVFHEVGDRTREAKVLNNLAALIGENDLAATASLLQRSLAIKREIDDAQGMALTLANLASVRRTQGDNREARGYLAEALAIDRRLGDAHGTAQVLRGTAEIEIDEGRFEPARAHLREASGLSRQNGDAEGIARAELCSGRLEAAAGRDPEAAGHFHAALDAFRRIGDKSYEATATLSLARLDLEAGRLQAARQGYDRGFALARELEDRSQEAHAHFGRGAIAAQTGDRAAARAGYERAIALWTEADDRLQVAAAKAALAKLPG